MKARFVWKIDDEGRKGWVLETHKDNFDPFLTIAHDLLEHFPDGNGDASDETLAFGAMLWIRGDPHYMSEYHKWNTGQSANWWWHTDDAMYDEILLHAIDQGHGMPVCTTPVGKLSDWPEDQIRKAIHSCRKIIRDREKYEGEERLAYYYDQDEEGRAKWREDERERRRTLYTYLYRMADWFRLGYRRAQKRYNSEWTSNYELAEFFHKLDRATLNLAASTGMVSDDHGGGEELEGMILHVQIKGLRTGSYKARLEIRTPYFIGVRNPIENHSLEQCRWKSDIDWNDPRETAEDRPGAGRRGKGS